MTQSIFAGESRIGAIVILVVGLTFAALAGAVMKLLANDLPTALIVWFRFAGFFILLAPIVWLRFGRKALRPQPLGLQVLRGCLLPLSTGFFVIGAKTLDYADAIAILYVYPFVITLIGPWLLGEPSRLMAWIGVGGGFAGVLLIMQPSSSGLQDAGAVWVLMCGIVVAGQMVLNRRLGRDAEPWLTSTWGAATATALLTPLGLLAWTPPSPWQLVLLMLLGALAAISQTLFAVAFARAPAAELAPFSYSEIVVAIVIGLVFFGTLPSVASWIGIAVIIASGVMVARTYRAG